MADQQTQLEEVEALLARRKRAARKARVAASRVEKEEGLNINSMMDMMVIILCFLLKSIGSDPVTITQSADLRLPYSTAELAPEDMITITVTKRSVMVDDHEIVPLTDGSVDVGLLQSAESLIIPELQASVEELLQEREQLSAQLGREFEKIATLICDSETQYRLLAQVMATANAGGIQNFKFAVIKRGQGAGLVSASD